MDYTLIHYNVRDWEKTAFEHVRRNFIEQGWPLEGLEYDHRMMIRGLVIDKELGNIVKANRFGSVKAAMHGTKSMPFEEIRDVYAHVTVELSNDRWEFLNTLFSMSEACLFAQVVDLLDAGRLPGVLGYEQLYRRVRRTMDYTHMEGRLKSEIVNQPERFVELDPDVPLALLDQYHSGKKLLLITNSEFTYSQSMMSYAFDKFLPGSMTWRDLFELVIVEARKPAFFTNRNPLFEVVSEDGLLRPVYDGMAARRVYLGGSATQVEEALGVDGNQILFVGDHIFSDVHVSKDIQRWRTALVLREIEDEVEAVRGFESVQRQLEDLMEEKGRLEATFSEIRLAAQRSEVGYGPKSETPTADLKAGMQKIRDELVALDAKIRPLAKASAELSSTSWGLLMRAGNDKSQLARQVERYADIYLSKVGDFLVHTPFAYLRAARGSLPHDAGRS
ncbi:MAG: HAD-IG family 5'-nucleotidase, partial [Myxococcota bacterium]